MKIARDILITLLIALALFLVVRALVRNVSVDGHSMEPSLSNSQPILVSKVAYWRHGPERGDIVVFIPPLPLKVPLIKRIIGLPGETVEIVAGVTYIDGQPLQEPYIKRQSSDYQKPVKVPEDHYFMMGDNRPSSLDSRELGTIPLQSILGKAWLSLWPLKFVPHYTLALGGR